MIWLLILLILFALTGALLQSLVGKGLQACFTERLLLSPVLGLVFLCAVAIFCLVLFDGFPLWLVYAIPGFLLLVFLARVMVRKPANETPESAPIDKYDWVVIGFSTALTVLLGAIAYRDGVYGDALSLWSFKARVLAEFDSLRIPAFQDSDYYHHHKDYPLLLPAAQALLYRLSAETLDRSAKLIYPVVLLCTSLFLYFHLKKRFNLWSALTGSGFCLLTPAICGFHPGICSAYMDIPLGCFTLLAFLFGEAWLKTGRTSDVFYAGLFITAMALTKNEGTVAAAILLCLFSLASLINIQCRGLRGMACLWLPLLVLGGAWFVFRSGLPQGNSNYLTILAEGKLWERAAELPGVVLRFAQELIHFERWGFLWIVAALTAPLWIRRTGWIAGLFLLGMVIIQIVAVTISPLGVEYQMASGVFRLPGQYAPLAAACIGIAFGRWMPADPVKKMI